MIQSYCNYNKRFCLREKEKMIMYCCFVFLNLTLGFCCWTEVTAEVSEGTCLIIFAHKQNLRPRCHKKWKRKHFHFGWTDVASFWQTWHINNILSKVDTDGFYIYICTQYFSSVLLVLLKRWKEKKINDKLYSNVALLEDKMFDFIQWNDNRRRSLNSILN